MIKTHISAVTMALLVLLCVEIKAEPLVSWKIKEELGVSWNNELIYKTLSFPGGAIAQPRLSATVNGKSNPCQVTDIERHDDGTIASLKVWMVVSVKPNEELEIKISQSDKPSQSGALKIEEKKDTLLLTTEAPGRIGVSVPKGGADYPWLVDSSNVPAPVQGLLLPSGATTAPGEIHTPFRVKSWKTDILAQGPVFVETETRYIFETGYWNFRVLVVRASPLVIITEEFDTGSSDATSDKCACFCNIPLQGKSFATEKVFFAGFNNDEAFNSLIKSGVDTNMLKAAGIRKNWFASSIHGYPLKDAPVGLHYSMSGYPTQQQRLGCMLRAVSSRGDAIGFAGLDIPYWRNPLSIQFRKDDSQNFQALLPVQKCRQTWGIDGFDDNSPNYTGATRYVPDSTCRRKYGIMLSSATDDTAHLLKDLAMEARKHGVFSLNNINSWVLDWPDPRADAAKAETTDAAALKELDYLRERLKAYRVYGTYAVYSMGLHFGFAKGRYKALQAVVDAPENMRAQDREMFRKLLAFNAYFMHSKSSFPMDTGFHLNNPNMTIMAAEARFLSSLLVKDHPQYTEWGIATVEVMREFFNRFTRPSGASYENPHYVLGATLGFAAPTQAKMTANGLDDPFDTERFRKLIRFTLDWLSPPDPRFSGCRSILPLGNCSYQSIPVAMSVPLVTYLSEKDPPLARKLQWAANQTYPADKKINIVRDERPELKSVAYEGDGVSFRHGFGTPYETLLRLRAGDCDGHYEWETDQLIYTLYAKGSPINLTFGNGYFPMFCRPWLRNRVSFDMKFETSERNETRVDAVALGGTVEYARAWRDVDQLRPLNSEYPQLDEKRKWTVNERENWGAFPEGIENIPLTTWHRQIMFLKDPDPKGPNYFVINDGFGGTPTRPTDVNFWFLATDMTRDGNVLHYTGQCDVNMDVYIHTPETFTPHTDSYGHQQQPYGALFKHDLDYYPNGKRWEEQMLLRIRQAPGKGYMTVLYPRLKENDPPAAYKRLADNVVEITTPSGTDVVLMATWPFSYKEKRFSFQGRAAAIRWLKDGSIVVRNAEDTISLSIAGKTVTGEGPFEVVIKNGEITRQSIPEGSRLETN